MKLLYKCTCMQDEGSFYVSDRTEDQDVVEWIEETVRPILTSDHRARNALCTANAIDYLKIPYTPGKPVGMP